MTMTRLLFSLLVLIPITCNAQTDFQKFNITPEGTILCNNKEYCVYPFPGESKEILLQKFVKASNLYKNDLYHSKSVTSKKNEKVRTKVLAHFCQYDYYDTDVGANELYVSIRLSDLVALTSYRFVCTYHFCFKDNKVKLDITCDKYFHTGDDNDIEIKEFFEDGLPKSGKRGDALELFNKMINTNIEDILTLSKSVTINNTDW